MNSSHHRIAGLPGDGNGKEVMPWGGAAAEIVAAIERVLADPQAPRTPDIGGGASTAEFGEAIVAVLR